MKDHLMVQQQVDNVWQHMVGVICLNLTNRKQVKAVLSSFLLNGPHNAIMQLRIQIEEVIAH